MTCADHVKVCPKYYFYWVNMLYGTFKEFLFFERRDFTSVCFHFPFLMPVTVVLPQPELPLI